MCYLILKILYRGIRAMNNIEMQSLNESHIECILNSFTEEGIKREAGYFTRCLQECRENKRISLVALFDGEFAGYLHVIFESKYPYFTQNSIPEINDLIVIPKFRRKGAATMLIRRAESIVSQKYSKIGLGVGLYKDYGQAQRRYFSLGYIPDGNGIIYDNKEVPPGSTVFVDDDLLIYLYKNLGKR
jgi:GNAT superfamily N-acetyltransferase